MYLLKKAALSKSLSITCALTSIALLTGCGGGGGGGGISVPIDSAPSVGRFVPNYAGETDPQTNQPNRLLHWANFPVRVHFVQNAHLTESRKALAAAGFNWWQPAFGGAMKIEIVEDPAQANIRVQFEPKGTGTYTGITQYSYAGDSQLVSADITLNLAYLSNAAFIAPTAAHEFGHALGIGGHSATREDLMASAPNVIGLFKPTVRDENTMKTAYIPVLTGRAADPSGEIRTGTIICPAP